MERCPKCGNYSLNANYTPSGVYGFRCLMLDCTHRSEKEFIPEENFKYPDPLKKYSETNFTFLPISEIEKRLRDVRRGTENLERKI